MRHVIVTRFSVPRPQDPTSAHRHGDRSWLEGRLSLFRSYCAPSTLRLGVPVVLLCSSASADIVRDSLSDLAGLEVVVQDDWHAGWTGAADQVVTRHDSDDALHEGWFEAVEAAPSGAEVCCTREFLRLESRSGRVYSYTRNHPSPLAAFSSGRNPFAYDHADLESHFQVHNVPGPYLLQVVHGGNLSSQISAWSFRRRTSRSKLEPFGLEAALR